MTGRREVVPRGPDLRAAMEVVAEEYLRFLRGAVEGRHVADFLVQEGLGLVHPGIGAARACQ